MSKFVESEADKNLSASFGKVEVVLLAGLGSLLAWAVTKSVLKTRANAENRASSEE